MENGFSPTDVKISRNLLTQDPFRGYLHSSCITCSAKPYQVDSYEYLPVVRGELAVSLVKNCI